ncbi:hypothetical protein K491DRAFT_754747 [Lophiostoma macrostomum CBS 122681]|uniref:DUF7580 domain-containing protein n=1 Tax=Lophiostoma macrostomum CBS 122681 TaxID=1314788 RepID=A0A6A6TKZ8_9PLEO|nr:hypothetical protein K491DRAFT_754747 [Lophiostoma macrostomum CBS 122681]
MLSFDECLQVLGDVLPLFEETLNKAARVAPAESHEWMYFIELRAQFRTLEMHLPHLSKLAERRLSCLQILRSILSFLEEALETPGSSPGASVFAFPSLERLREDGTAFLGNSQSTIRYHSPVESERSLEHFDIWTKKLERLIKYPTTESGPRNIGSNASRPSSLIRDMAKEFMAVAENRWQCECSSPHDLMLFVKTYRDIKDGDDHVLFKMLFATKSQNQDKWREGNVYVMLPSLGGASIAFDLPRKAPRTREPLPDLCTHLNNTSQSTSVNMRLQNAQFHQTRRSRPQFRLWDAIPGQTVGELLLRRPILSAQSKILLAVLVSYSVLHFHNTSWLPFGWDNTYFYVPTPDNLSPFALRPLLVSNIGPKEPNRSYTASTIHKHPDLLQLGIVLLEIFVKEPIEELCKAEDLGPEGKLDSDVNFYTADRVYDDHEWDVHEDYKAAVAACLRCDIPITGPPYDNLEYARYIYEQIIIPLEREFKALCNLDIDRLDEKVDEATFNDNARAAQRTEAASTADIEVSYRAVTESRVMAAIIENCSWPHTISQTTPRPMSTDPSLDLKNIRHTHRAGDAQQNVD